MPYAKHVERIKKTHLLGNQNLAQSLQKFQHTKEIHLATHFTAVAQGMNSLTYPLYCIVSTDRQTDRRAGRQTDTPKECEGCSRKV